MGMAADHALIGGGAAAAAGAAGAGAAGCAIAAATVIAVTVGGVVIHKYHTKKGTVLFKPPQDSSRKSLFDELAKNGMDVSFGVSFILRQDHQ